MRTSKQANKLQDLRVFFFILQLLVSRAVLSTIRRQRNGSSGVTPRFIVSYRDVARLENYTRIPTQESCDDYITIKCHVTYEVNELFITYCNILSFLKRETKANI